MQKNEGITRSRNRITMHWVVDRKSYQNFVKCFYNQFWNLQKNPIKQMVSKLWVLTTHKSDAISPLDTQPKNEPRSSDSFGLYKWLIMNEMYLGESSLPSLFNVST